MLYPTLLLMCMFGHLQSDFNCDGIVNYKDLCVLQSEWLMTQHGPELVLDGSFDTGAGWLFTPPWNLSLNAAAVGDFTPLVEASLPAEFIYSKAEKHYYVSFDVITRTAGSVQPRFGSNTGTAVSAVGSYSEVIYCADIQQFEMRGIGDSLGVDLVIDNVSVKEILTMALTRAQIKSRVQSITGKSNKDSLIEDLCDSALKECMLRHKFEDARDISDVSGVVSETTIALPADCKNVISIAVIDSNNHAQELVLKGEDWYNKHVGVPEQYNSGWPEFGSRFGSSVYLDRPLDASYTFRIRHTKYPTFTDDTTICPIEVLDTFLVYYVSALIFQTVEDNTNYNVWMRKAVGSNFDMWNGGAFGAAVQADEEDNQKPTMLDINRKETKKPTLFTDDGTAWISG